MSKGRIVLLALIACLLAAALVLKANLKREAGIVEEARLKRFFPSNSSVEDVQRVEIFQGRDTDKKVTLERRNGGWVVPSLFNVRADELKVKRLLETMESLQGEFRSESPEVLPDYGLDSKSALHYVLYVEGGRPLLHLLVGKGQWKEGFVRVDGSNKVFRVAADLRGQAGIYGSRASAPRSSIWMRRVVLKLKKEDVEALRIKWPDKELALKRQEPKRGKEQAESREKEGADAGEAAEERATWMVERGGPGLPIRLSGVKGMLSYLGEMRVKDAVDPKERRRWGLEDPPYRLEVKMAGGKDHLVLGGRPDPSGDGYLMVDDDPAVYRVGAWEFQRLFPAGERLFSLDGWEVKESDMVAMGWTHDGVGVTFKKEGQQWRPTGEIRGLGVLQEEARKVAKSIAMLRPADYTDLRDIVKLGLDKPWAKLKVELKGGRSKEIRVGSRALAHDGRYALLGGGITPVVISSSDLKRIMPPIGNVLDLRPFPGGLGGVRSVVGTWGGGSFVLSSKGDTWRLAKDGKADEVEGDKVQAWLSRLATVKAVDLVPRVGRPEGRHVKLAFAWRSGRQKGIEVWEVGLLRDPALQVDLRLKKEDARAFFLDTRHLVSKKQ